MFIVKGEIVSGKGEGKKLGYPTINIKSEESVEAPKGVYIISSLINKKEYKGIANWGSQPTFNSDEDILEVHLFDFKDQDIPNKAEVNLIEKIRDIKKFDSIKDLVNQINKDKKVAIKYLKSI